MNQSFVDGAPRRNTVPSIPSNQGALTGACALFWVTLNFLFCLEHRLTTRRQTIALRNLDF